MPHYPSWCVQFRGQFEGKAAQEIRFCLRCYLPDCVDRTPDCPLTLAERGDPEARAWKARVLAEVGDARELVRAVAEEMIG